MTAPTSNPYFKFFTSKWLSGDILECSLTAQGLFVNICALYWSKAGSLTLSKIQKKFPRKQKYINELVSEGIMKISGDTIEILFLDEQLTERGTVSHKNKDNANKRWNKGNNDATALPNKCDGIPIAVPDTCQLEKIREDKNNIASACCLVFGKDYKQPEERINGEANFYSDIDYQVDVILGVYKSDSVAQIKAYIKYCQTTKRKLIGTAHKLAETIISSDWIKLNNPGEHFKPPDNPFKDAEANKKLWTDDAWRKHYWHMMDNPEFKKHFNL